ncbi:MAG: succinyldiaminopimelate transaminase [Porticoccaceae bacterium]|nr:MAG: succinyldiaminopimelate transaminase [Porticoccaceae bacterium]
MNPRLDRLLPYPFERLRALLADSRPPADLPLLDFAVGEPRHAPPAVALAAFADHLEEFSRYPSSRGLPELRAAICRWLARRFAIPPEWLDPERHVLPAAGSREALFAIAQAALDPGGGEVVVAPNPGYQIYEGAALLAGAELHYADCVPEGAYRPDYGAIPPRVWERCALVYLCSPHNPTGAVLSLETFAELLALADRYDFAIASDECYSEIYFDEDTPPVGLLGACAALGRRDFRRCLVFHSLSKRSNLPGLRSGFVAGDAALIARFAAYRTYHGATLPLPVQRASIAAWNDEAHVAANRRLYREKFAQVLEILRPVAEVAPPQAGFYLWLPTPIADDQFARLLHERAGLVVLPGRYLGRPGAAGNPGENHVRIALVGTPEECREGALRLAAFLGELER